MHGGAISLAKKANGLEDVPDLILVSDMLDLALFKALLALCTNDKVYLLSLKETNIYFERDFF